MSAPEPSHEAPGEPVPSDLAEAGIYPTTAAGFDHGLVVLAMGQPYWLVPVDSGYRLLVEPSALASVREQLACFDRESIGWPPQPAVDRSPGRHAELSTPLLWALVVLAVFWCQGEWPGRWEDAGALDAQAIFEKGEWWRPATALFLHADLGHLVANVISGVFAFSATLSTIGRRRGWLLLALAALAGNLAIAAAHYPGPYRSLGASTAVFAALGLLTGRAIRLVRRAPPPRRWQTVFVPCAAGLILLALFGAGEMPTDVGAHVTGFAVGLVLGFAAGVPRIASEPGF